MPAIMPLEPRFVCNKRALAPWALAASVLAQTRTVELLGIDAGHLETLIKDCSDALESDW